MPHRQQISDIRGRKAKNVYSIQVAASLRMSYPLDERAKSPAPGTLYRLDLSPYTDSPPFSRCFHQANHRPVQWPRDYTEIPAGAHRHPL